MAEDEKVNSVHARKYVEKIESFKSERWCDSCWLLKHLCICGQISALESTMPVKFHLFLHYKEFKRTSNTGILIKKLFPNSGVYISGYQEDKEKLYSEISDKPNVCVLYPGDKSINLEAWLETCIEGEKQFILLDSTWNQGRKLLNSLPKNIPRVKLVSSASSLIKCKKQANKGYFSTLECAALILKAAGDMKSYEEVMKAFVLKDKAALKQTNKHSLLKNLEEKEHYSIVNQDDVEL
jgi:DTW domain-containing protein YfiP